MKSEIVFGSRNAHKEVIVDDIRLLIVATCLSPREWSVRVENERGIRSEWHDFFTTAEAAVQKAEKAIEEEGAAAFVNIEGFDYLN